MGKKTTAGFDLFDISVDVDARDAGAWIDLPKPAVGLRVKAKGFSAPDIVALQITLEDGRPDDYETNAEVKAERNRFENRELSKAGIVDWEPFAINGQMTKFSPQKRDEIIDDPRFENFIMAARIAMTKADDVKLKKTQDEEKNSGPGLAAA